MSSKTEIELREATDVEPSSTESKAEYLNNLFQVVVELGTSDWQSLSFGARRWYDDAVAAYDADQPIPTVAKKYDNMKEDDDVNTPLTDEDDLNEQVPEDAVAEAVESGTDTYVDDLPELPEVVEPAETKPAKVKSTTRRSIARDLDKFGTKKGTKAATALEMFEKGATMAEVKKVTGGTHYNLLRDLPSDGHKVWQEPDGRYVVRHKDEVTD